jgi:hypothetical protein
LADPRPAPLSTTSRRVANDDANIRSAVAAKPFDVLALIALTERHAPLAA